MYCTNCGIELAPNICFCENCGTKIENSSTKEIQYNYIWKNCGTCIYWAGSRRLDNFRTTVIISDSNVKGECVGGGRNRSMTEVRETCSKYEKWSLLNS